jgi:hypothetical protein
MPAVDLFVTVRAQVSSAPQSGAGASGSFHRTSAIVGSRHHAEPEMVVRGSHIRIEDRQMGLGNNFANCRSRRPWPVRTCGSSREGPVSFIGIRRPNGHTC